jgi:fructose/tagatose bisphosphate aldolase
MDSVIPKLKEFQSKNQCTLLGVGPMSKNCVDSVLEIVKEYNIPLMLIASRRQIESEELGGGYVNNWSTEEFSKYVKMHDSTRNIILCRDHGGPWQNNFEKKTSLSSAIESSKRSYKKDIESGFEIIHIDASEDTRYNKLPIDDILERSFELYEYCWDVSKQVGRKIEFEISIGKEDGGVHSIEEIEYALSMIKKFCYKKEIPTPLFFVVRTGNQVMETRNIGNFTEIITNPEYSHLRSHITAIIKLLNNNKIMLKEHNTDYLSDELLKLHPTLGIHAANVAPEFGVVETRAFLDLLKKNNLSRECEQFIDMSYKSEKWKKWVIDSNNLQKTDKAIICGHYIFSTTEFIKLKECVKQKISCDVDLYLKSKVKTSILRYLTSFNMI